MPHHSRPWLFVVPIATIGVLFGHELAYRVTGTPSQDLHGYLAHAPRVALVLIALSAVGASFVIRGTTLALWPFPLVTIAGFAAQEHLEQLQHGGSLPFLLDRPVFLVGILIQCAVALVAWFVARLFLRVLRALPPREPLAPLWSLHYVRRESAVVSVHALRRPQPRAPPATG